MLEDPKFIIAAALSLVLPALAGVVIAYLWLWRRAD